MKKILSVMLAIMMIFGALSVSASAANDTILNEWRDTSKTTITIDEKVYAKSSYVVVEFDFNGGKSYVELPVYDAATGDFVYSSVSDKFLLLPGAGNQYSLIPGEPITLPLVTPAEGEAFRCWYCVETGQEVAGGSSWYIPQNAGGQVYHFKASFYPAEAEGDTLTMVLGVLMKVFGTIAGILFLDGSSAAGIELMEKLLGGLLG